MPAELTIALAMLVVSVVVDQFLGEYPYVLHPVVWFGKTVESASKLAPRSGWWRQFLFGAALTLLGCTLFACLAWLVMQLSAIHPLLQLMVGAYILKGSWARRELDAAAGRVQQALQANNLTAAREGLRSLCSRDPSDLSAEELIGATIESVAENASDSIVAPFFYFAIFGVAGAAGYRAINTLDAMIGYRGKFEALGKFAARLDDVANWIPARLTALLMLLSGFLLRCDVASGWRILRRDGSKTPSPNAGRPMAVMAGLLGVALEKRGVYLLGDAKRTLTVEDVAKARRVMNLAAWLMYGLGAALVVYFYG